MQAEFGHNRGNGFIISPGYNVPAEKKKTHNRHPYTETFDHFKEYAENTVSECIFHAKVSGKALLLKIASALTVCGCVTAFFHFFTVGTAVSVNGKTIGISASQSTVRDGYNYAETICESVGAPFTDAGFSSYPVITLKSNLKSSEALGEELLLASGNFIKACRVYSGDTLLFTAENKPTALRVTDEYIKSYSMNGSASLSENLDYVLQVTKKSDVFSEEQCLEAIKDSNCVNVVSVVSTKTQKVLPFETATENDSSLYIGETVTVSQGKNGNAEICEQSVYENGILKSSNITEEKITIQPVKEVIKVGTKEKKVLESGLTYPLKGTLSSPFGARWGRMHEGIDIAVAEGTPVKAAECGTVSYVSENAGGYGKFIQIDHGYGIVTAYAHLSSINVTKGQKVPCGFTIGLSGNTGRSTGPHLHFEITENDTPLDPLKYLKN